jgi:ribosomal-protein-alanine N-acetyltransferase
MTQATHYYQHETERLFLHRLQKSEIADWAVFFDNNPNLPYLGLISSNETKDYTNLDWSKKWIGIQFERYQQTGYGLLAVISKETGELIGQAGILQKEIENKTEHEIAYSLLPNEWGKGYASEMSSVLVDYAIEHQINSRIISIIHIDNIASQNVARKNKMAILFKSRYAEMDVYIYGRDI